MANFAKSKARYEFTKAFGGYFKYFNKSISKTFFASFQKYFRPMLSESLLPGTRGGSVFSMLTRPLRTHKQAP